MTIGAQMYTLRTFTQNTRDFSETMARVAKMGYQTVQLSAIGPMPPKDVKQIADDNGLKIVLTHTAEARILNDIDQVIEDHKIFDCEYVGLGAMSERYRESNWADRFVDDFMAPMEKMRDAGMLFMYHNHAFEFQRMRDGRRLIDILMTIPADLMGITLDMYWLQFAGCDVHKWTQKLKDRIHCVHLKDMTIAMFQNRFAPIGDGNMEYKDIIAMLDRIGTTKHMLVEQDDCYGADPFECMKRSCDFVLPLLNK